FVAHPQCQAQIGEMWYSGVPFLRYLNRFAYLMLAIPIGIVVCPAMSFIYLVSPWAKVARIVNTPLMKFLSYTCSYLTFLLLIISAKLYLRHHMDTFTCEKPDTVAYVVVTLVFLWIMGLIFEECKQIYSSGAKDYFASFWNMMDSIMLSLLLASFVLELITPMRLYKLEWQDSEPVTTTVSLLLQQTHRYRDTNASTLAFFFHAPSPSPQLASAESPICHQAKRSAAMNNFCQDFNGRVQVIWDPVWVPDPELLSDVLFSLGMIFSVSRFSFIMPANEALGTMLVSFRRTLVDIAKIMGMFILVLMAFTCGMAALYSPSRCQNDFFSSFTDTLSTLTWSVFGLGNIDAPRMKDDSAEHEHPVSTLTNNPQRSHSTATVGIYLYGLFIFCTNVVLLNLLIAVMSNTFQEVQDERDIEWKFARTELWLTFVEPGNPVPPPFNIIPSPRFIWKCIMWMLRRSKFRHLLSHEGKKVRYVAVQTGSNFELQDMSEDKSESSIEGRHTRNDVMCLLVRRYVRHVERMKIEGEDGEKKNYLFQGDKYAHLLDEAKLQILSRMDSERIQMERVLEHRVGTLVRKLDESTRLLSQQVDKLQGLKGQGSAPASPSRSK
uniref:Ion transport domain-containing protein n=1 Tax=Biomphalaria glabrata TaxID=6526 RepID=A0A2C9M6I9_BIOGL